ncbi:uncharacterized protein LOC123009131 [Tribolium madens]|uniref:uncharacterized protein LOC123009131 n=1 Tax=Tribolium madens TaxID=41895 RepID=UPI001CF722E4|nr:uncharacterized protein LOC123009131 [Tribolium madens]
MSFKLLSLVFKIVAGWEWYYMFYYNYLIYIFLKIILNKYKELNKILKKQQDIVVVKMEYILLTLQDAVDNFNEIFGWPFFFLISYSTLLFLDYTDDFVNGYLLKSNKAKHEMIFPTNIIFEIILVLMVLKKKEINEIIINCTLANTFPEFTAAGFFVVRKSTILTILGTTATFLIIMVQFEDDK